MNRREYARAAFLRRRVFLPCILSLTMALACAAGADNGHADIFADLALEKGFRLSALRSSMVPVEIGSVFAGPSQEPPRWRLAQWGSRFDLLNVSEIVEPDGARLLANEGKSVRLFPGGLSGEGILLAVHGGREYDGALRKLNEPWPHLLIEQRLGLPQLTAFTSLRFALEFRIDHCASAVDLPLDPSLHTAHINAFFTIHNKNHDSPDYNDMIWFGLPLFDARHPIPPGHQALDAGQPDATGKFICTMPGTRFYDGPVAIGDWHRLECDLLPLVREALAAARQHGFLLETSADDLTFTSFNLGWEVPGPYDCSVHLRKLSLSAQQR